MAKWPPNPGNDTDDFYARVGAATQVGIGALGPGGQAAISLGGDTSIYRSAADTAKTDDAFFAAGNIQARSGGATQVQIGNQGPGGESGIILGSANDVNLYRAAADNLKTDDALTVGGVLNLGDRLKNTVAGNESGAASAGAAALPANPLGFLIMTNSAGNPVKVPYYNP